jgi:hypothetical protein
MPEFTHAGLSCKVVKTKAGHFCGYVVAPEDVEPRELEKQDELSVFGGITYGPDDENRVGFDDAHARKIVDERDESTPRLAVEAETRELANQLVDASEGETDV